jgi:hypothetical protein
MVVVRLCEPYRASLSVVFLKLKYMVVYAVSFEKHTENKDLRY